MVVNVKDLAGVGPTIFKVSDSFHDIKKAEKARIGYLDLYPKTNPQNVSVLQYVI